MVKRVRPRNARADRKSRSADRRIAKPPVASPTAVMTWPSAPPSPPAGPPAEAVALFQQGMDALQRHSYDRAAGAFRSLVDRFPNERALLDRSRVYLELCERELRRRPPAPKTIEERVTAATAALNNREDPAAETLARSVLAEVPSHDLALYLLAAIEARRGAQEAALDLLNQAITASPEVRAQARHDADFEILRSSEEFRRLMEPPHPTGAAAAARRPRRLRTER